MRLTFTLFLLAFLSSQVFAQQPFLFITSPESAASSFEMGVPSTDFGFSYQNDDEFTGEVLWAFDRQMDSLACDTVIVNDVAGKFALIRRGDCFFSDKIQAAQQAGASGALICNDLVNAGTIDMSAGSYQGLDTIPSAFLSFETCAVIDELLEEGETVEVTIRLLSVFVDGVFGADTYTIPQEQIRPVNGGYNIVNSTNEVFEDVRVTLDIENPSGEVQSFEINTTLPGNTDTVYLFPDYLPAELGTYTMTYTDFFNDITSTTAFNISDLTYATDNDNYTGGIGPDEELFIAANLQYQTATAAFTGSESSVATFISFGIENVDDIFTGEPDADLISVILYDADANDDGVLDLQTSFSQDLTPVAFGAYTLTGNEQPNELIFVPLESILGDDIITLEPNSIYYAAILYDGTIAGTGVAPEFTASSKVTYSFPSSPLELDQLYGGGWGGATVITRLHLDGFVDVEEVQEKLEDAKVALSPNPATDFVNLSFDLANNADEVKIGILDVNGNLVSAMTYENVFKENIQLPINDLASGTYFLSIVTPEGYRAEKLIIVK